MGGSNQRVIDANGLKDYDVNYNFASYLGKYLNARGEKFAITRDTSEAKTQIELDRFITYIAPDITVHIKCLEDISPEPKGYIVECDKYSALAATISSEFRKWGASPVYPIGYKVESKKTIAKYTEIIIGIGYLTNTDDANHIKEDGALESLARAIIDAAYGPPTKVMQPKDDVYVADPYMYNPSIWSENQDTKLAGDTGGIIDDRIENIPVKVLSLKTVGEHATPYTWSTPLTIPAATDGHVLIVSVRTDVAGKKAYVKLGSKTDTTILVDNAWHRITFKCADGDTVFLGSPGDCTMYYTALWVTPSGSMGNLDDPQKQYSIFPPGYRPLVSIDPTAVDKSLIPAVITQANTLMGRAQDNRLPDINGGLQSMLSKVDQLALSPKALVSGLQGMSNQFGAIDLKKIDILDPSKVKNGLDYKGMENTLKSIARGDKKSALQKAINDMKGVEQAANHLLATLDQKLERAKKQAELIKKRMEKKGEAMSKP